MKELHELVEELDKTYNNIDEQGEKIDKIHSEMDSYYQDYHYMVFELSKEFWDSYEEKKKELDLTEEQKKQIDGVINKDVVDVMLDHDLDYLHRYVRLPAVARHPQIQLITHFLTYLKDLEQSQEEFRDKFEKGLKEKRKQYQVQKDKLSHINKLLDEKQEWFFQQIRRKTQKMKDKVIPNVRQIEKLIQEIDQMIKERPTTKQSITNTNIETYRSHFLTDESDVNTDAIVSMVSIRTIVNTVNLNLIFSIWDDVISSYEKEELDELAIEYWKSILKTRKKTKYWEIIDTIDKLKEQAEKDRKTGKVSDRQDQLKSQLIKATEEELDQQFTDLIKIMEKEDPSLLHDPTYEISRDTAMFWNEANVAMVSECIDEDTSTPEQLQKMCDTVKGAPTKMAYTIHYLITNRHELLEL